MVTALEAGTVTDYATASEYANDNGLSVRSVIAKVKSLGLDYTPKTRVVGVRVEKSTKQDTVVAIAKALSVSVDSLNGLANAKASALDTILEHLG